MFLTGFVKTPSLSEPIQAGHARAGVVAPSTWSIQPHHGGLQSGKYCAGGIGRARPLVRATSERTVPRPPDNGIRRSTSPKGRNDAPRAETEPTFRVPARMASAGGNPHHFSRALFRLVLSDSGSHFVAAGLSMSDALRSAPAWLRRFDPFVPDDQCDEGPANVTNIPEFFAQVRMADRHFDPIPKVASRCGARNNHRMAENTVQFSVPLCISFRLSASRRFLVSPNRQLQQVFNQALEIKDVDKRRNFLDEACGNDFRLREQVDRLLKAYAEASTFLESPVGEVAIQRTDDVGELRAGTCINEYQILEKIGSGGFGVVYRARQNEPVRREVALKLIKPGMDTREVISRFNVERQAMALMDHPAIATILDAGATETGRPFFVMEFVSGIPVTAYCDQHRLTTTERLELFIRICDAIHHAHQKGVIHRDLKPSNILVSRRETQSIPKIIDFGIAKAIDNRLTDDSVRTRGGQLVGTPLYMSPEQAATRNRDVDIRSDIYSLGVLLFELLTGSTPVTREQIRNAGYDKVAQLIQEQDTPRPSSRLSESVAPIDSVASDRNVDPSRLKSLIRGDLDWIVMKALEKDRERRYESASALARDIERFLNNDPIDARPPSTSYRLRKFVRKNRIAVATGLAFSAVLIGATAFSSWQAIRATNNETLARQAADAASLAKRQAIDANNKASEALTSERQKRKDYEVVWKFIVDTLRSPDPGKDGRKITLVELLERKRESIRQSFNDDPKTRSAILLVVADTYRGLGLANEATPLYEEARTIRQKEFGPQSLATVEAWLKLAMNYSERERLDEALQLAIQVGETCRKESYEQMLVRGEVLLASIYNKLGQPKTSEKHSLRAHELSREMARHDIPIPLAVIRQLANTHDNFGRFPEALELREDVLAIATSASGPESADAIEAMNQLANSYLAVGRFRESRELRERAVELAKKVFGEEHVVYSDFVFNMDWMTLGGDFDAAIENIRHAIRMTEPHVRPGGPTLIQMKLELAETYRRSGDAWKAMELLEALFVHADQLADGHPLKIRVIHNLALAQMHVGDLQDAVRNGEDAVRNAEEQLGESHPSTIAYLNDLGLIYGSAGRVKDSIRMYEKSLVLVNSRLGGDHPSTLTIQGNLGRAYTKVGEVQKGLRLLEQAVTESRERFGKDHSEVWQLIEKLADAHFVNRNYPRAMELQSSAIEFQAGKQGPDHPFTLQAMAKLANTCIEIGENEKAIELLEDAHHSWMAMGEPQADFRHSRVMFDLGYLYLLTNQNRPALELFLELVRRDRNAGYSTPQLAIQSLDKLALCHTRLNQHSDARDCYKEIIRLCLGPGGEGKRKASLFEREVAVTCIALNEYDESVQAFERFLESARPALDSNPQKLAVFMLHYCQQFWDRDEYERTAPYVEEACQLVDEKLPETWLFYTSKSGYGSFYLNRAKQKSDDPSRVSGDLEKAEQLLTFAFDGLAKEDSPIPDGPNPGLVRRQQLRKIADQLIDLYSWWDKQPERTRWQTRRKELGKEPGKARDDGARGPGTAND